MSLILLVDDDTDMLMLTQRWLQKAGYEVITASSGEKALETLGVSSDNAADTPKASVPDLILLDYAMPGMDGPAVYKALKADAHAGRIPVIFRTGVDDAQSESVLNTLNPEGVVSKSEGKPALIGAIARFLQP